MGKLFSGLGKALKNPSNAFFGGLLAGDWVNLDIKPEKDSPLYQEGEKDTSNTQSFPSWLLPAGLVLAVIMVVKK